MPYLGNAPLEVAHKTNRQDLTGGSGTDFTLDFPVGNATDLEVFVNHMRQEPDISYTCAGTALTMTGTISATDDFYVVFQGKASGVAPKVGSGFFQGNNGNTGDILNGKDDIFRVHSNTLSTDTVIGTSDNALASGALTISATLKIMGSLTIV